MPALEARTHFKTRTPVHLAHWKETKAFLSSIVGTSIQEDKDKLRDGQHLVVGTPGRSLSRKSDSRCICHI